MKGISRSLAILSPVAWVALTNPASAEAASSENFELESARLDSAAGGGISANFDVETVAPSATAGVSSSQNFSVEPTPIPEPSGSAMRAFGVGWLLLLERWRRGRKKSGS